MSERGNKDVDTKMGLNKLAILRSDVGEPCPYGLRIPNSCLNVGDAIFDMVKLDEAPEDEQEKTKELNRRVYRHQNEGQPCPFSEGVVKPNPKLVNCNASEGEAAGSKAVPFRGSPFYPKVYNGLGSNLWVSPFGNFTSDSQNRQFIDGMFAMYSEQEQADLIKTAETDQHYEFEGDLDEDDHPTTANKTSEEDEPAPK